MRLALLATAVLVTTTGMVLASLYGGMEAGDALWPFAFVLWAPVGALILFRRPGNGVGWTMLAVGLSWGVAFLLQVIAFSGLALEIRAWAEVLQQVVGVLPWLGIVLLLLLFPSGLLTGRTERLTAVGLAVFGVVGAASFVISPTPMENTGVPSPLAIESLSTVTSWVVSEQGFLFVVALVVSALVSVFRRWRASFGIERHQYRWLFLGASVFALVVAAGQLPVFPEDTPFDFMWLVAGAAIPVVIGIAVLRYRLYEIDRIISRTVSYTVVVGLLGLVLFALVAGLGSVLGRENQVVVAASTLAVAGLFSPVRRRVQGRVDRRFNRSRYDAEQVMSEFVGSLRGRVDPDGVMDGWVGVVAETMQPSSVGVWVRSVTISGRSSVMNVPWSN
jgi:hypothetical protein